MYSVTIRLAIKRDRPLNTSTKMTTARRHGYFPAWCSRRLIHGDTGLRFLYMFFGAFSAQIVLPAGSRNGTAAAKVVLAQYAPQK